MGLFDFGKHDRKELERLLEEALIEEQRLTKIIDKLINPQDNKPILTLSTIINNKTFIMADISLVLGVPETGIFTLIDNKTGAILTGVTFSNQTVGTNTNPSAASFALDANNNVAASPIVAGTGQITITATGAYTDLGDGSSQTGNFSVTKNFTVTVSADGVTFDVQFS